MKIKSWLVITKVNFVVCQIPDAKYNLRDMRQSLANGVVVGSYVKAGYRNYDTVSLLGHLNIKVKIYI
jgi:hypothetical protein